MKKFSVISSLFLLLTAFASVAHSETSIVKGSGANEFQAAVQTWLDGNDLAALSSLSSLAKLNNRAAQILLARIEGRGTFHKHVTGNLPRKRRIELLRRPGGLSGKSWMALAKTDEPLAAAFLKSTRTDDRPSAVKELFELDEPETAMRNAYSLVNQGRGGELLNALNEIKMALPEEAGDLLSWAIFQSESKVQSRYAGSAKSSTGHFNEYTTTRSVPWEIPSPRSYSNEPRVLRNLHRLLPLVKSWDPIRQFCNRYCPQSNRDCMVSAVHQLWSLGPFAMRSPSESIISNERYFASARIEGDLMRSLPRMSSRYYSYFKRSIDQCYFESLNTRQSIHGYLK